MRKVSRRSVKLSIITISYNSEKYIEQCLASLSAISSDEIERILIDGGSTDRTNKIIAKYRDIIDYYISEEDKGPANALNKGLRAASGEYVYILNSDDYIINDLTAVLQMINQQDKVDCFYGNALIQRKDSLRLFRSMLYTPEFYVNGIVIVPHQATIVRRSLALNIGGYNETNPYNWDGELFLQLKLQGAIIFRFKNPFAVFRIHSDQISEQGKSKEYLEYMETLRKKNGLKKYGYFRRLFYYIYTRLQYILWSIF